MFDALSLVLDHIEKVVMILRSILSSSVSKMLFKIMPQVRLSFLSCGRSGVVTIAVRVIVVIARASDPTLICHTVLARAHAKRPLLMF